MDSTILPQKNQRVPKLSLIITILFCSLLFLGFSLEEEPTLFNDYLISHGPEIKTNAGFFYDDGGLRGNYKDDKSYIVKICPETPGTYAVLEFQEVAIADSRQDELSIFDGDFKEGLGESFGKDNFICALNTNVTQPGTYTASASSDGCLKVRFRSTSADRNAISAGWKAKISNTTMPSAACFREIKGCGGTFVDRGETEGDYANNSFEVYTICPDDDRSVIELDFTEIYIDTSDILSVYSGKDVKCFLEPYLKSPQKFVASKKLEGGGCLTVTLNSLKSNGTIPEKKWKATINCVSTEVLPPDACFCKPNPNPANTCDAAPMMKNIEAFCGSSLVTFKANTNGNINKIFENCGTIHNNSFIRFKASATTAKLRYLISGGSSALCTAGFQLAVLELESDDCNATDASWRQLDCINIDSTLNTNAIFPIDNLTPGNLYYLMIDGSYGNDCVYTLNPIIGFDVCPLDINYENIQYLPDGSFIVKIPYKGNGSWLYYDAKEKDKSLGVAPFIFQDKGIQDTIKLGPYPAGSAYSIKIEEREGEGPKKCEFTYEGQTACPVLVVAHEVYCLPNENGAFKVKVFYKGDGVEIPYTAYEENASLGIDSVSFTDNGSLGAIELGPYPAGSQYSIKTKSEFMLENCNPTIMQGQGRCPFCPLEVNQETVECSSNGAFTVKIPYQGNRNNTTYRAYEENTSLGIKNASLTNTDGTIELGPYPPSSAYSIKIEGESGLEKCDLEVIKGQTACLFCPLEVNSNSPIHYLPDGSFKIKVSYQGNENQTAYKAYEQGDNSLGIDTVCFTNTNGTIELGPYLAGSAYNIKIKGESGLEKCDLEVIKGQTACPVLEVNDTVHCLSNGFFMVEMRYKGNGKEVPYIAYEENNSLGINSVPFIESGSWGAIELGPYPVGSAYNIIINSEFSLERCDLFFQGQSNCPFCPLEINEETFECALNGSFIVKIPYQGNGNNTVYKAYEQGGNSLDLDTFYFGDIDGTIELGPYPFGSIYNINIEGGIGYQKCDLEVEGQSDCPVVTLEVTTDYSCFTDETGYFIIGEIEDVVPFPIMIECNNYTDMVVPGVDQSFKLGPFPNNAIQIHQMNMSNSAEGFSQSMDMNSNNFLPEIVDIRREHATCNKPTGNISVSVGAGQAPYDFTWSNNNNNSPNNVDLSSGNYKLTVTDANNCRVIQNDIKVQEMPILDGASVMPNPGYNQVDLIFDNCGSMIFSYGIFEATTNNRVLAEQTNKNTDEIHMINTSQLHPGVYFIVLQSEGGIKIIPWIKL